MIVRRVLRIHDRPANVSSSAAYSAFQRSMLISAIRCTLTYVIFPFVVPALGFATGVGPIIGIAIGVVAMTCDVFTIRRFFAIDHKWRWHVAGIATMVIGLLSVLLVQDIIHLLT
jgi:ABC-type glucose/galactose transport system permease subunit